MSDKEIRPEPGHVIIKAEKCFRVTLSNGDELVMFQDGDPWNGMQKLSAGPRRAIVVDMGSPEGLLGEILSNVFATEARTVPVMRMTTLIEQRIAGEPGDKEKSD